MPPQRSWGVSHFCLADGKGMDLISRNVTGLSANVAAMSVAVQAMAGNVSVMSRDINHGTRTFTSPQNFMWNMMPKP